MYPNIFLNRMRVRDQKNNFLFFNQHVCFGYSKEPSQLDNSSEHPEHVKFGV